jgi:hypothetical protein
MITYQLSKNILFSAAKIHQAKSTMIACCIASLAVSIAIIIKHGLTLPILITLLICIIILWVFLLTIHRFYIIKIANQFHENAEFRGNFTAFLKDNELNIQTDMSSTRIPRDRIYKIKMNDQVVLLYVSSLIFYVIPRKSYDSFIELKNWLEKK